MNKPLSLILTLLAIFAPHQVRAWQIEDVQIGQSAVHYLDPEFIDKLGPGGYHKVMFTDTVYSEGSMWVADLDPVTGQFFSADGRDLQLDTGIAPIYDTIINGPEWGVNTRGLSLFYTKYDPNHIKQIWRADLSNPPVLTKLTSDTNDNIHWAATLNEADTNNTFFLVRYQGATPILYYTKDDNLQYNRTLPGYVWPGNNGPRFIPGTPYFVYSKQVAANKIEIVRVDTRDNTTKVITDDNIKKVDCWGFAAPEFGGEECYSALISDTEIGFYRYVNPGDPFATRVGTITCPDATHPYVRSIEILQTGGGLFDRTYFAFLGSKILEPLATTDGSMWIGAIAAAGKPAFIRRVDRGGPAPLDPNEYVYRQEPELLIGASEVFLYYNSYENGGIQELRRCRTGILVNGPGNQAPVVYPVAAPVSTVGGVPATITLDGADPEGDPITYSIVTGPAQGSVSINGSTLTYTPPAGFSGTVSFTYRASDGSTPSNIATVSVTVTPTSWSAAPSSWSRLKFKRDYVPGAYDTNGNFMGGTATMFLTPHQGKLWAGIGYWNDLPGTDPTPGPQILVKDAFDAPWKVDFSFGTGYLRVDGMRSVTFTTDRHGNALTPPVTMLMAAVSDISPPQETTVWTRAENTNVWTKTTLGSGLYARMIFDYQDKVTGIHHVFAADESSALYRGGYDVTAPGRLVWNPVPEITGPQRMLSTAVANGDLYLGVATDGNPANNFGGVFKRVDGASPSWQFVYEWPLTGTLGLGSNLRGLTAIPDPNGGGHQVLIGVLENLKQIVRIDPANGNSVTVELDLEAYFDGKWGAGAIFYYAAYNDMLPITDPKTGEPQHLIGVWARHPDATNTRNFNNTWYLIRHADGTYEHTQVIDPAIPIPTYPGLWAVRSIVPSPFPQEAGRVLYLGGADAGGGANPENPNTQWHNTAWIYRATRPDENMGLTKTGSSATVRLDTVHGWSYQLQYSLNLGIWTNLGPAFPGNNAVQQSTQNVGTQPRVFFRAQMTKTTP